MHVGLRPSHRAHTVCCIVAAATLRQWQRKRRGTPPPVSGKLLTIAKVSTPAGIRRSRIPKKAPIVATPRTKTTRPAWERVSTPVQLAATALTSPRYRRVLNGGKMWITNSPIADLLLVWARTDADGGAVIM